MYNLHHLESLKENWSWWPSPSRWWVSGLSAKKLILLCVLVDYSETGTTIYIQSTQDKICAIFSSWNEAPIVWHSNVLSWCTRMCCLPNHMLSWHTVFLLTCHHDVWPSYSHAVTTCHPLLTHCHDRPSDASWWAILFWHANAQCDCQPIGAPMQPT